MQVNSDLYTFPHTQEHHLNVAKLRLNQTLIFALITAFITLQWTVTHIHLAEQHHHNGDHHHHQIETHAHQLNSHHADSIDSSHQMSNHTIVELDHEPNLPGSKIKTAFAAAITYYLPQPAPLEPVTTPLPVILNTKLSHLDRSTVNLRAPPPLS